jgi:hypothetical protein
LLCGNKLLFNRKKILNWMILQNTTCRVLKGNEPRLHTPCGLTKVRVGPLEPEIKQPSFMLRLPYWRAGVDLPNGLQDWCGRSGLA